jgi:HK97 family phage major capsid protein
LPLGRTGAGTLRLSVDATGLRYEIDPPDTQARARRDRIHPARRHVGKLVRVRPARHLAAGRGGGRGQARGNVIERNDVQLFDVGPVVFPAYGAATSGVRAADADRDAIRAEVDATARGPTRRRSRRRWRSKWNWRFFRTRDTSARAGGNGTGDANTRPANRRNGGNNSRLPPVSFPGDRMTFQVKGLREKRAGLVEKLRALGDVMRKESRSLNAAEQEQFAKLKADLTTTNADLRSAEKDGADIEALIGGAGEGEELETRREKPGREDRDGDPRRKRRARGDDGAELAQGKRDRGLAFAAWARSQHGVKPTREQARGVQADRAEPEGARSRSASAGRLDPEADDGRGRRDRRFNDRRAGLQLRAGKVDARLLQRARRVRPVHDRHRSVALAYPTEDDTSSEGIELNENTETDFNDDTLGSVTFYGFKFSSQGMLISYELLNDSAFDLETHIGGTDRRALGRIQGRRFTTGTGTRQPQGIVTASTLGVTAAGATAFTATELTRLAFSIDRRTGIRPVVRVHDARHGFRLRASPEGHAGAPAAPRELPRRDHDSRC